MANKTFKLFADKLGGRNAAEYIGNEGEFFYDPALSTLRISDGSTVGGKAVGGIEQVQSLIDSTYQTYQATLTSWQNFKEDEIANALPTTVIGPGGWEFLTWNVTGENVQQYLAELTAAWQTQQLPTSPPSPLVFVPAISSAFYNQIRTILNMINGSYSNYLLAIASKQIVCGNTSVVINALEDTITLPEVVQTTPEEDLVIRTRYAVPTSPPGVTPTYDERDFVFKTNGTIQFPDGSVQSGAAISLSYLKTILNSSADFAAFKATINSL